MSRPVIAYIPVSHLDLFWLGSYKTCLQRGADVIRQYLDRCLATTDETFLLETVVFAEDFLRRHPEYREPLTRLVYEGRVELGAAYIDRWEHLVLGESHIRNIQLGKRWYRETFGRDNALVAHPDLPGFIPQVAQIYAQAGIKYYVTSRKVFEDGAIWRLRAPDGSSLIVLNYPKHYAFVPLDAADIPERLRTPWTSTLDLNATLAHFPLNTVLVSGGAGDLADRETFRDRYGRYLEEFVAANRDRYPDVTFTYATPSQVLAPYDDMPDLPARTGEVPSVWGIALGEEGTFFARDREIEGTLLTAETLAVVAERLKIAWLPPSSASWQGTFYDAAFFAPKDPIPADQTFRELWRMHVFTHDHNGGGQEGVLSSFQKRVMQDRCEQYAGEIIAHTLDHIARRSSAQEGACLIVFNPDARDWTGPVALTLPAEQWPSSIRVRDESGTVLPVQPDEQWAGQHTVQVSVSRVPALGYRIFAVDDGAAPETAVASQIEDDGAEIRMHTPHLAVTVDRRTGNVTRISDLIRGEEWGSPVVGRIYALHEVGNDVSPRLDAAAPPSPEEFLEIDAVESGPLFTRLRIQKRVRRAAVEQTVTLWTDAPRVDLRTRIFWWGEQDRQVRLGLPSVSSTAAIAYGSPFYAGGWMDVLPGAAPHKRDEVQSDDYPEYREIQGWLHLSGDRGGLTICTSHPAFHRGADGLEALLIRTPRSCGDARLHWSHAGELCFSFVLIPGDADWRAARAPLQGARHLKPPVARLARAAGEGVLPAADSFLRLEEDSCFALLSSLYPAREQGGVVARVYDAGGRGGRVRLSGPLAEMDAAGVDMLEEQPEPVSGHPGEWRLDLTPWRIQTLLLTP